jgi:hypothetical protein
MAEAAHKAIARAEKTHFSHLSTEHGTLLQSILIYLEGPVQVSIISAKVQKGVWVALGCVQSGFSGVLHPIFKLKVQSEYVTCYFPGERNRESLLAPGNVIRISRPW